MKVTDSLKPRENHRVIDLVKAAGVDVRPWAKSSKGPVKIPAANPAYCYDWAFTQPGRVVVLNVWHKDIHERNGKVWFDLNPRSWSEQGRHLTTLKPSERGTFSKRAIRMDHAIAEAFRDQLPVRLIIGEGFQRDIFNPKSKKTSRMKLRLLDPEAWSVQRYNPKTGECRLSRGAAPRYVDQFTMPGPNPPRRHDVSGKAWERDRKVRDAALFRAQGKCELCSQLGFLMVDGGIYLETHHVVPLSEKGVDHESNVVALCPNDHREAHHGKRRDEIRTCLLAMLAEDYG